MKKCIISLSIAFLALFASCDKQNPVVAENSITKTNNNSSNVKAKGVGVKLKFTAGHPSSQCSGQGACFNYTPGYWPNYAHIPCQGYGSDCSWEISIDPAITKMETAIFGITEYERDTFLMPDRSLLIPDESVYLNIPQQAVLKEAGGYRFNNLSVTDQPLFENL